MDMNKMDKLVSLCKRAASSSTERNSWRLERLGTTARSVSNSNATSRKPCDMVTAHDDLAVLPALRPSTRWSA